MFLTNTILKLKLILLEYAEIILINMNVITQSDSLIHKTKSMLTLGYLLSPLAVFSYEVLGLWYVTNSDYVFIVLLAIAVDHLLGTIKYLLFIGGFSLKKNIKGIIVKLFLVITVGALFEGLNIIVSEDSIIKDYLIIVTRLMVFLYPTLSALESASVISKGKFPPKAWIEKIKAFQKDLKTKNFKNE